MIKLKEVAEDLDLLRRKKKYRHAHESINEAPDHDMFRALNQVNNDIFKIMNKYDGKADMDAIFRSWMLGIHAHLKKAGIKLK